MDKKQYDNGLHKLGRIFTIIALSLIVIVPIIFCIATSTLPSIKLIIGAIPFMVGYIVIGLIEAISYAPLLGTGGQYLAFITGNISNLKLPCALNAQSIAKCPQGSEEQEIITTIAIGVSSIVTTIVIIIGLIPLALFSDQILKVIAPVSPYVIPAIFGGLGVALLSKYLKLTIIPFTIMLIIAIVTFALGMDLGQSTMIPIGMAVSIISAYIMYKKDKKAKQ